MALNREMILGASDHKVKEVEVPEWGGTVLVGTMSGEARDAWEASLVVRDGKQVKPNLNNVRARLVACTVVDEEGNRIFAESDVAELGKKSSAALDRVCAVAQRLNGLTNDDLEELKGN